MPWGVHSTPYEKHLGIPEWLARVEDKLFENMSAKRAKTWPVEFANAIKPGTDLNKIKGPFLIMLMERSLLRFDHQKFPDVKAAIDQTIACWKNPNATPEDFAKARAAARAAEEAARAAEEAARAAEYDFFADALIKLLKNL